MASRDRLVRAFAVLERGLGRGLDVVVGVVGSQLVEVQVGGYVYGEPCAVPGIERPEIRFRHGRGRRGQRRSQGGWEIVSKVGRGVMWLIAYAS